MWEVEAILSFSFWYFHHFVLFSDFNTHTHTRTYTNHIFNWIKWVMPLKNAGIKEQMHFSSCVNLYTYTYIYMPLLFGKNHWKYLVDELWAYSFKHVHVMCLIGFDLTQIHSSKWILNAWKSNSRHVCWCICYRPTHSLPI